MAVRLFDMCADRTVDSWLICDVGPGGSGDWPLRQVRLERVPPDYVVPLTIQRSGPPMDVTYAMPMGTLIAGSAVAEVFRAFCDPDDVQCLEAAIQNGPTGYKVIHYLREYDCVDNDRSAMTKEGPRVVLESSRIGPSPIFCAKNGLPSAVVREDLKQALEAVGARGVLFREVEVV